MRGIILFDMRGEGHLRLLIEECDKARNSYRKVSAVEGYVAY